MTGILLVLALVTQFRADRYLPGRYWTAVTLVSVFGTLVTDNLTDALGVPLEASTVVFAVLLAVTFGVWYRAERTLSIHAIRTRRREAFYWTAIPVTFALGTAAGDLLAQVLGLGFLLAGVIVAAVIAVIATGWRLGLHSVLSFWIIYVLTRPLGASIGDYLSQPASDGGLDLGATTTSLVFFAAIVGMVGYLAVTKADVLADVAEPRVERGGLWQSVVVVGLLLAVGVSGYLWQTSALQADGATTTITAAAGAPGETAGAQSPRTRLGDLSAFRAVTQDTLQRVDAGSQSAALARVRDLEIAWDDAEAHLKPPDKAAWIDLDGKIDKVLREVRATSPDPTGEKTALTTSSTPSPDQRGRRMPSPPVKQASRRITAWACMLALTCGASVGCASEVGVPHPAPATTTIPPAGPVTLSGWKLTLPVAGPKGHAAIVDPAAPTPPWLVLDPSGGLSLWAPVTGSTTRTPATRARNWTISRPSAPRPAAMC